VTFGHACLIHFDSICDSNFIDTSLYTFPALFMKNPCWRNWSQCLVVHHLFIWHFCFGRDVHLFLYCRNETRERLLLQWQWLHAIWLLRDERIRQTSSSPSSTSCHFDVWQRLRIPCACHHISLL